MSWSRSKYIQGFRERVVRYALEQDVIDYGTLEKKFNVPRKTVYNWVYNARLEERRKNEALSQFSVQAKEASPNGDVSAIVSEEADAQEQDRVTWIVPGGVAIDYLARIAIALERLADLWEK